MLKCAEQGGKVDTVVIAVDTLELQTFGSVHCMYLSRSLVYVLKDWRVHTGVNAITLSFKQFT